MDVVDLVVPLKGEDAFYMLVGAGNAGDMLFIPQRSNAQTLGPNAIYRARKELKAP